MLVELLRKNRPPRGIVALLPVTEKQFAKMDIITGDYETDVISSIERLLRYEIGMSAS